MGQVEFVFCYAKVQKNNQINITNRIDCCKLRQPFKYEKISTNLRVILYNRAKIQIFTIVWSTSGKIQNFATGWPF